MSAKAILCVDDEVWVLKSLEVALSPEGYRVFTTSDPAEAETILREHEIDLVLLDVCMPDTDGRELCATIRDHHQVPILFVTGQRDSFSVGPDPAAQPWTQQFGDGQTDILYKPFEVDELHEKVAGLIGPAE